MISKDDVQKLAKLARIKIETGEEERLASDMDNILAYVTQIKDVSGTLEIRGKEKVKNALREDSSPHEPGIFSEELIAEAPKKEGRYFKVKKIL